MGNESSTITTVKKSRCPLLFVLWAWKIISCILNEGDPCDLKGQKKRKIKLFVICSLWIGFIMYIKGGVLMRCLKTTTAVTSSTTTTIRRPFFHHHLMGFDSYCIIIERGGFM